MTILTREDVINVYRKRAKRYNITANLYYLIGFRMGAYRKKAVDALNLRRGDTVVEIGCGTGLNFSLLQQAIGPDGKIIGVDLSDAMLAQARKRVEEKGWANVELVLNDAASYKFPEGIDGVISTFALTLVAEYDMVIQNGCRALNPGKRWVVLDLKMPSGRVSWLAPLLILLTRPFGVTIEMAERHPWESINKYLRNTSMTELYMGFVYIAEGERGRDEC
ncbi:MAG: class I SAM-dependent methyltransferase [Candidatus Methanoperedens sp.]|nr:class I SAM-dependent methyltransferase [Candidatus Methanoperedens sp.]